MNTFTSTKQLKLGFPTALESIPDGYPVYGVDDAERNAAGTLAWPDGGLKWSGGESGHYVDPPKVGEEVYVVMNGIGPATVRGYFVEYGFLGVYVQPHNPPAWYVKQNGVNACCHVFGAELGERK